ncbi:ATPase [candidate division LCP-89 bacterium B3_LCP]|uniref:ATPase n=1 Tax=candidate division LCP-89 bacterium B3_LCP TaxID=2012998 RepID=A0A532UTT0_UNCL8|nr:MAG: ATPase [candidate division LCP-89 bacterium B3_LCP]
MDICSQCILPGGQAGVALDEKGVCNHCRNHEPVAIQGEEKLIRILEVVHNNAVKYDCIVNISGGRDSAYTLLALVRDYRMKVLAVNYANPFTDPQATKNIANMVRILDVDFVQFELKNNIHERILRNNILAWFKNPTPALVPAICIGCKIIWPTILKIARKNRIKCIVNGGNPYEYSTFKKVLLGVTDNANLKSTYLKNVKGLVKETLKNAHYLKPKFILTTIKGYLFSNPYALGSRLISGKLTFLDLFHYIPWKEDEVLERIQEELGWDYPRDLDSSWRFDCRIAHLKDYMYLKTLGITEKDDFYAKMIREGMIERDEAIQRVSKENKLHLNLIHDLFSQLSIDSINLENELYQ